MLRNSLGLSKADSIKPAPFCSMTRALEAIHPECEAVEAALWPPDTQPREQS